MVAFSLILRPQASILQKIEGIQKRQGKRATSKLEQVALCAPFYFPLPPRPGYFCFWLCSKDHFPAFLNPLAGRKKMKKNKSQLTFDLFACSGGVRDMLARVCAWREKRKGKKIEKEFCAETVLCGEATMGSQCAASYNIEVVGGVGGKESLSVSLFRSCKKGLRGCVAEMCRTIRLVL